MLIPNPPKWPTFGAVRTKLRYDAPIPVAGGKPNQLRERMGPEAARCRGLLPNGASIRLLAGIVVLPVLGGPVEHGLLLRMGGDFWQAHGWRPEIASNRSRTRSCATAGSRSSSRRPPASTLRWSYQSCDLDYRVWGDFAVEDFYFYPDALGTRVLDA